MEVQDWLDLGFTASQVAQGSRAGKASLSAHVLAGASLRSSPNLEHTGACQHGLRLTLRALPKVCSEPSAPGLTQRIL